MVLSTLRSLDASAGNWNACARRLGHPNYNPRMIESWRDLPALAALPALRAALAEAGVAVLTAPPGSGKTTALPLGLLESGAIDGRMLVLEPRRLAARLAAQRMADSLGEAVGQRVGYQVRGERHSGPDTRIEVLTEGLLTRRLQADPELPGVELVVFDEFHERSLHVDLALALSLDVRRLLRPDLKLLVMSATLDAEPVARLLGGAPRVSAEGRRFDLEIRHGRGGLAGEVADCVTAGVRRALTETPAEPGNDILAFLPGRREIEAVFRALDGHGELSVHRLHSGVSRAAQAAAVRPDPGGRRKLILATNIAQTSVTIDGVGVVVDGGFERRARVELGAGVDRLETVRVSRATAEQRAGRAGRQRPGVAYRMWSPEQHGRLPAQDDPEIVRADLTRFALEVHAWGTPLEDLALLDAPPPVHWQAACETLQALGAIDRGRIGERGRALLRMPLSPRLAALMQAADARGLGETGAWLAAVLEYGDALPGADLLPLVAQARRDGGPVAEEARRLARAARGAWNESALAPLVAQAYPERVARRRRGSASIYRCADGSEARVAGDARFGEWLAIAHWAPGSTRQVRRAATLDPAAFEGPLADQVETGVRAAWDPQRQRVVAQRGRFVGALALDAHETDPGDAAAIPLLVAAVKRRGADAFAVDDAAQGLIDRVASLRHWHPEESWPAVDAASLAARAEQWLPAWAAGMRSLEQVRSIALAEVIRAELGTRLRELDRRLPERWVVPSGSSVRLRYGADGSPPRLSVRLQEMFGATETPRVDDGRVPVTVELLSPAMRPIQRTQDLNGFWRGSYAEVRKEMRGRYPKHHWPEDPLAAVPTRRSARPR